MKKILSFLILALLLVVPVSAGDHFNGTTSYYDYGVGYVNYSGSVTFTVADSNGSFHSKPILIGNANDADGYITTQITTANGYTAASACTVLYHFSNDLETWVTRAAVADADMDLDAVTLRADTLGQFEGANDLYFHSYTWMILEFDGENANPGGSTLTWDIQLKPDIVAVNNGQAISLGAVATRFKTAP